MSDSDLSSPWLSNRRVRPLDLVPLGTKAPAIMGGWWLKMATGWKWNGPGGNGGTFPRPGGDWDGHVILPDVEPAVAGPTGRAEIAHDGFAGDIIGHYVTREGKRGVVVQQDGTRVVHVYGEKWLLPPDSVGEV